MSIRQTCFHKDVYEPAEDSFALADAAIAHLASVKEAPRVVLEVGSGSGFVLASVAVALKEKHAPAVFFATDRNRDAAATTSTTMRNHGFAAEVTLTDLMEAVEGRLAGQVDLLLFNPPYVPSPPEEVGGGGLPASWAGGFRGRVVIDRFLPKVPGMLSPEGVCLLLAITQNDVPELKKVVATHGLTCDVVLVRSADEEKLHILKICRAAKEDQ